MNEKCCLPYQQTKDVATIEPLQLPPTVSPEETQDGDKQAVHCQALSHCSQPHMVHPEGTQDGEVQDTVSR